MDNIVTSESILFMEVSLIDRFSDTVMYYYVTNKCP